MLKLPSVPFDVLAVDFAKTVLANQVTILVGETGSGKTTRAAIYLDMIKAFRGGTIGVTEPRRLAAISVAQYDAKLLEETLGQEVGYQVRFDDQSHVGTRIKFMTDGILLREIQLDPLLSRYSVIMIDEAHERSLNIDLLLGLLKRTLAKRPNLRLVVASATIDKTKFSTYFNDAPVIEIPGRTHPVEIHWYNPEDEKETLPEDDWIDYGRRHDPWKKLMEQITSRVRFIHQAGRLGDILIFLPGEATITRAIKEIEGLGLSNLAVLPAHGSLSPDDQQKIFADQLGCRKVVVATNIGETSLTIDGVVFVIDSGLIKQTNFSAHTGVQSLDVTEHSQAGCQQRAGRAGRTQPGICYRLYSQENYNHRPQYTEPEMTRSGLANVVLTMLDMGIDDVEGFDFIDQPDPGSFHRAYQDLMAMGAVDVNTRQLTPLGKKMAVLPLEPKVARMVLEAREHDCVEEAVTIASFWSVGSVFCRPKGRETEADNAHGRFHYWQSDMITHLNVWRAYLENCYDKDNDRIDFNRAQGWCYANFLNSRNLWEIWNIRWQLIKTLKRLGVEITSNTSNEAVMKSVVAGLILGLMINGDGYSYAGVLGGPSNVFIHPSSVLFKNATGFNQLVVVSEIRQTSKLFALGCSVVNPEWLAELAPDRFSFSEIEFDKINHDGETVSGHRYLLRDGRPFLQLPVVLIVEEATVVNNQQIAEAKADGCLLATITGSQFSTQFAIMAERILTYPLARGRGVSVSAGDQAYCKLTADRCSVIAKVKVLFPEARPIPEVKLQVVQPVASSQRLATAAELQSLVILFG